MRKMIWANFFIAALLLSSCATTVPDIRACSGIEGVPGVSALCRYTNSDKKERLTLDEWLEFLYAQPERPDPKNPGKMLPAKGPAIAVSSDDYRRNDTAMAALCAKGKCTYEQKKALERMQALETEANKPKPKAKAPLPR
jgi:hypothetical protein